MAAYTSQEYYDMLMALGEYTPNCTQIKDIHRVTLYLQQLKGFTILAMSCRTNTILKEIAMRIKRLFINQSQSLCFTLHEP
ncbi:hypothetical protein ACFW04_013024 [Cataglyphis niger]